jgi:glycosyltransferase involved in cell wall biosynthesis
MKVLFLVPYPLNCAPSQRFRFEQYLGLLSEREITYEVQSFLPSRLWSRFYRKGHYFQKALTMLGGYWRRFLILFKLHQYDVLFIHREATPLGPGLYQWALVTIFRKKIIFDFDDAIWMPNYSAGNSSFSWLKRYKNALWLMKNSWKNSCGNAYLRDFAGQFNPNSFELPTTVDTTNTHNRVKKVSADLLTVGWTGTHSTGAYLESLLPVLRKLQNRAKFKFRIISDINPHFENFDYDFVPWQANTEIDDLIELDIGLMPLEDDQWALGKCGLKALQYMSLGIPSVVSPVGVNAQIISDGENGLFARTEGEWENQIARLLTDSELRMKISKVARPYVESHYSVEANKHKFLDLFAI